MTYRAKDLPRWVTLRSVRGRPAVEHEPGVIDGLMAAAWTRKVRDSVTANNALLQRLTDPPQSVRVRMPKWP